MIELPFICAYTYKFLYTYTFDILTCTSWFYRSFAPTSATTPTFNHTLTPTLTPTPKINLPALWVAHHGVTIHLRSTSTRWLSITRWATRCSATIVRSGRLGQGHGLWAWGWHGDRAWPGPGGHWHWGRWGWSEAAFGFATVVAAAAHGGVRLRPAGWVLVITPIL